MLTASVAQVNQPHNDKAIDSAEHVIHRMQAFLDAYAAYRLTDQGYTKVWLYSLSLLFFMRINAGMCAKDARIM